MGTTPRQAGVKKDENGQHLLQTVYPTAADAQAGYDALPAGTSAFTVALSHDRFAVNVPFVSGLSPEDYLNLLRAQRFSEPGVQAIAPRVNDAFITAATQHAAAQPQANSTLHPPPLTPAELSQAVVGIFTR